MPILYVHGVFVRNEAGWEQLQSMMRRYIAPVISDDPESVLIDFCFWGDFGAKFRWNGLSTPDSPLRHALTESVSKAKSGKQTVQHISDFSKMLVEKGKQKTLIRKDTLRLKDLNGEKLSNLCASLIASDSSWTLAERTLALLAADEIAAEPTTLAVLNECAKLDDEMRVLQQLIKERYRELQSQFGIKSAKELPKLTKALTIHFLEGISRAAHGAGFAFTRAAAEVRMPVNQFVTTFIGDVLQYLYGRGNSISPGQIPLVFLESLAQCRDNQRERNGEPLIVLSHSMGGQIVYDVITHFLPRMPEFADLRVDFWCASASQIGLFEELKLFIESSDEYGAEFENMVPFPDRRQLGYWWNIWDYNDFVSYSAKGIIDGVDDEFYNTGMFLVDAHGGYLVLPSFFRRFAKKLESAKALNWMREAQPV